MARTSSKTAAEAPRTTTADKAPGVERLFIVDTARARTIEFPPDGGRKAFKSVQRRLGRVRRVTFPLEIGGEFIVGATYAQLVRETALETKAFVVFSTPVGDVNVPMESEARAARVAKDASIRLLSGLEAHIEGAVDGDYAIFEAYGVSYITA